MPDEDGFEGTVKAYMNVFTPATGYIATDGETVEVDGVDAKPRRAPVEVVGRVLDLDHCGIAIWQLDDHRAVLLCGDVIMFSHDPGGVRHDRQWRVGRLRVRRVVTPSQTTLRSQFVETETDPFGVVAMCAGDWVFRVGAPTTPSLEERVADLERRVAILTNHDHSGDLK